MVEMSSFTLPPSIRRFGRCMGEDDVHEDNHHPRYYDPPHHHHPNHRPSATNTTNTSATSSILGGGVVAGRQPGNSDRVKTFMNGIVSPFTACFQPTVTSCVSGGGCAPDYSFRNTHHPAVVSPLADRQAPTTASSYKDSSCRASPSVGDHDEHGSGGRANVVTSTITTTTGPTTEGGAAAVKAASAASPTTTVGLDIEKPHANDVLCGRGGSSNRHQGNIHFRELVAANKKTYVGLTKKQKMLVARSIVDAIHSTDPPGRFLAKDLDTGLFYDIGLPRSLEKTSQALREKNSNELPDDEGEGIETSVESYSAVVGSVDSPGPEQIGSAVTTVSPVTTATTTTSTGGGPKTLTRSSKHVDAPPLVIPPHLFGVFGPKGATDTRSPRHDGMGGQGHHPTPSDTNNGHRMGDHSPYQHHPSPYGSPYGSGGGMSDVSSPQHPQGPYRIDHPPPLPSPGHHLRGHNYPGLQPPGHGGVHQQHRYGEPQGYYYKPHPQTPPYGPPDGRYGRPEGPSYPQQQQDHRESYNDYYQRSVEREQYNSMRAPPHRMDPQNVRYRPPLPYRGGPPPPAPLGGAAGYPGPYHSLSPGGPHHHLAPPQLPPPPPYNHPGGGQQQHPAAGTVTPISPPSYGPSYPQFGRHYSEPVVPPPTLMAVPSHLSDRSHPPPPSSSSSEEQQVQSGTGDSSIIIYRTPSNGYVRGTSEVSPERQRDIKRQRNGDVDTTSRMSETALSAAVKNSLSLEERVVGRERQSSSVGGANGTGTTTTTSTTTTTTTTTTTRFAPIGPTSTELTSPSMILQSRSRRSMVVDESSICSSSSRTSPFSEKKDDYSALSGLAALSTAAFLKLDEVK